MKYLKFLLLLICIKNCEGQKLAAIEIWKYSFLADLEVIYDSVSIKSAPTVKHEVIGNLKIGNSFLKLIRSVKHNEQNMYVKIGDGTKPVLFGRYLIELTFTDKSKKCYLFDVYGNYVKENKLYFRNKKINSFIESKFGEVRFQDYAEFSPENK